MVNRKNKTFLKLPTYQGGSKALKEFIASNLKYPDEAIKNNIHGTVFIHYDVDDYGDIINAVVVKGLGFGCDEEGLRIVKMLKYNKVKNTGQRVKVSMKININFQLPQPQISSTSYQYNYTETENLIKTGNTSYSYTINIEYPKTNE